ncbi:hypothetical protein MMC13_007997 [Lambiella insularis]|nr:hypothetical protein [Lambiella insularis]
MPLNHTLRHLRQPTFQQLCRSKPHPSLSFHRPASTLPPPSTQQTGPSASPFSPRGPPPSSRLYRTLIYSTLFILTGLATGNYVRLYLVPAPPPLPSSPADLSAVSALQTAFSALPIVLELRAHSSTWTELDPYASLSAEEKPHHLTAGAMAGSRGLGVHRVFWNEAEQRSISVVYFGAALTGWPGVTHGGAIATLLQESVERVGGRVEGLEVRYVKPTMAGMFYVLRTEVDEGVGTRQRKGGVAVKATLETVDQGVVCVSATARCVPRERGDNVESGLKGSSKGGGGWGSWYSVIQNALA